MIDEIAFLTLVVTITITFFLYRHRHKHPGVCSRVVIDDLYANWVEERLKEPNPITAVQALRNLLQACSIFITATLILLGLLVAPFIELLEDATPFFGESFVSLGQVKAAAALTAMFACVFSFTIAAWMAGRAGMLVTANPAAVDPDMRITGISVTKATIKTLHKYWLAGVRGFFFMLGIVSWLITPITMIIGTLATCIYLVWFQDIRAAK
ncbi:MAG: DUF599 domain-containing protein [Candidatus Lokiarchaeota archaeon]|nr:DUF599 domain-containing protein [Candidatus Lokiarchaeota archaeon]